MGAYTKRKKYIHDQQEIMRKAANDAFKDNPDALKFLHDSGIVNTVIASVTKHIAQAHDPAQQAISDIKRLAL